MAPVCELREVFLLGVCRIDRRRSGEKMRGALASGVGVLRRSREEWEYGSNLLLLECVVKSAAGTGKRKEKRGFGWNDEEQSGHLALPG